MNPSIWLLAAVFAAPGSASLTADPPSIEKTVVVGYGQALTSSIIFSNTASNSIHVSLVEGNADCTNASDQPWLSLPTTTFSVPSNSSFTAVVNISPVGLSKGSYLGTVCAIADAGIIAIPIQLNIVDAPADPENLIGNGQMNVGIDGWASQAAITGGGASWNPDDGTPTAGSLELVNPGACDCEASATYCAAVKPQTPYIFSLYMKNVGSTGTLAGYAASSIVWHSDATCTAELSVGWSDQITDLTPETWTKGDIGVFVSPIGAKSAAVSFFINNIGATPIDLLYDDVELVDDRIFRSSFE